MRVSFSSCHEFAGSHLRPKIRFARETCRYLLTILNLNKIQFVVDCSSKYTVCKFTQNATTGWKFKNTLTIDSINTYVRMLKHAFNGLESTERPIRPVVNVIAPQSKVMKSNVWRVDVIFLADAVQRSKQSVTVFHL